MFQNWSFYIKNALEGALTAEFIQIGLNKRKFNCCRSQSLAFFSVVAIGQIYPHFSCYDAKILQF